MKLFETLEEGIFIARPNRFVLECAVNGKIAKAYLPNPGRSYILILQLKRDKIISVGNLGAMRFRKGYYLYAGSARTNLSQRVARHQRKRKNLFSHIDYLRHYACHCAALPVRASADLEREIAAALDTIAQRNIPGFGSSDCSCSSHLFFMQDDPARSPQFIHLLLDFRINRIETLLP